MDKKLILKTIALVNDHFNTFDYKGDLQSCNRKDYWKTPEEFLADGCGDCEDFSIIKFFQLRQFGIPACLVYCIYLPTNEKHMVAMTALGGKKYLLDNIDKQLKPVGLRPDILPIFKMTEYELTTLRRDYSPVKTVNAGKVSKWMGVLKRSKWDSSQAFGEWYDELESIARQNDCLSIIPNFEDYSSESFDDGFTPQEEFNNLRKAKWQRKP